MNADAPECILIMEHKMSNSSDKNSSPTSIQADGSNPDWLLSREDAAVILKVKPQTLAVWATTKRYPLPVVKVGRLARYRMRDLIAFIEHRTLKMDRD